MKIVIAVRSRLFSEEVLAFLKQSRLRAADEIHLVAVSESPIVGYNTDIDLYARSKKRMQEMIQSLLMDIKNVTGDARAEGHVFEGDPNRIIVDFSKSLQADLIILCSLGRGKLGRFFLGSTSLAVLAASPCSVLVLKGARGRRNMDSDDSGTAVMPSELHPSSVASALPLNESN